LPFKDFAGAKLAIIHDSDKYLRILSPKFSEQIHFTGKYLNIGTEFAYTSNREQNITEI